MSSDFAAFHMNRERSIMDVLNEACKGAILINGGAAVAMGALLQAIWDRGGIAAIKHAVLVGILITVFGVALAGFTFVLRFVSLCRGAHIPVVDNAWGVAAMITGLGSIVLFVAGCALPVLVALCVL